MKELGYKTSPALAETALESEVSAKFPQGQSSSTRSHNPVPGTLSDSMAQQGGAQVSGKDHISLPLFPWAQGFFFNGYYL